MGLGLSADEQDLYVAMNLGSSVGVLRYAAEPARAAFEVVCAYSGQAAASGVVQTCALSTTPDAKGCNLFRPFDVAAAGQDLYVSVTQGLTWISLGTSLCQQIAGPYFGTATGYYDGVEAPQPVVVGVSPGGAVQTVVAGGGGGTALDATSLVNVPFRVVLSRGTGVLYFADMENGAVRRVLVEARCECPAGLQPVAGANACYNPSPRWNQVPSARCRLLTLAPHGWGAPSRPMSPSGTRSSAPRSRCSICGAHPCLNRSRLRPLG